MPDLKTTYMNLSLKNPVIVAACSLSGRLDKIKRVEEAGAGALVIKSLFEEQIRHEAGELEDMLHAEENFFAESLSFFPQVEHGGPREHLLWIEKARKQVEMPLIGSINASSPGAWTDYAKRMADTGIDGLELNLYSVEADMSQGAEQIEKRMMETVSSVRSATDLPLAVKLSPFYTSMGNVARQFEGQGAQAAVLFNRFLQPDIDPDKETLRNKMSWSTEPEMRLPLRWISLLYGRVGLDLAGNTGVANAEDVAKFILAGAAAVQVASCLYRDGIDKVTELVKGLDTWMQGKGYAALADFRGKLSQKDFKGDANVFERAHYMDFLMGHKS